MKKSICFVAFDMTIIGGVEQVTTSLANALCEKYDVFIYSINHLNEEKYQISEEVTYYKGNNGGERLRHIIINNFKIFIDFVKNHKIDYVIMMGNYPALITLFTKKFTKATYIYCDHGALINQWKQKDITLIRLFNAILSDRIVTLTEKTKQDYIKRFHIRKDKIDCIYNWIDPLVIAEKKPYDVESKKILSVGRFGKEKGYEMLIEIASDILKSYPDWKWEIYGTGETFDEIKKMIFDCKMEKQIILKGDHREAFKEFYQYSFFVLTSYREGLPIVLLESLGLGIPMVSFDVLTGPREIIVHKKTGFLIEPYNCDEMRAKISELIDNPALRVEQSNNTCEFIDKFSYEHVLNQWIELFEEER